MNLILLVNINYLLLVCYSFVLFLHFICLIIVLFVETIIIDFLLAKMEPVIDFVDSLLFYLLLYSSFRLTVVIIHVVTYLSPIKCVFFFPNRKSFNLIFYFIQLTQQYHCYLRLYLMC